MKTFLLLIVVLMSPTLLAQQISGKVVDNNNIPLSGASIYFDGSTIGTTSREDGRFSLNFKEQSNLTLIVRYIGYKTFYLSNPDPETNYEITLSREESQLDEVVLDASIFTRKQMLRAFKRDFLGETKAGRKSTILNEDDIRLYYDKEEKSLHASSSQPIQVINKELGYRVEFDLEDFISEFSMVTLRKFYQKTNNFVGTSFFKDISKDNRRTKRKRLRAYEGSPMHFFKSLCTGNLEDENYQVFQGRFQVQASSVFEVKRVKRNLSDSRVLDEGTDEDSYEVSILGNDFENIRTNTTTHQIRFIRKVVLLHEGNRTDITFRTKRFYVDDFGNHTHINHIWFSGEMSKGRLGGMLPLNYQPND